MHVSNLILLRCLWIGNNLYMSYILFLTRLLTLPDMTLSKDFWESVMCVAQGGVKHLEKHTWREALSGSLCPFVFCVSSTKWSRN